MGYANKQTNTLVNGGTLTDFLKTLDYSLTQAERVEWVNRELYDEYGKLKDDFVALWCEATSYNKSSKNFCLEDTYIGSFYEAIGNYILMAPDAKDILAEKNVKKINKYELSCDDIMETQIEDCGFKDSKLRILPEDLSDKSLFDSRAKVKVLNTKKSKGRTKVFDIVNMNLPESLRINYDNFQEQVINLQHAIDHLKWQTIDYIASNKDQLYILYEYDNYILKNGTEILIKDVFLDKIIKKAHIFHNKKGLEKIHLDYKYKQDINKRKIDKIIGDLRWEQVELKKMLLSYMPAQSSFFSFEEPDFDMIDILSKDDIKLLLKCPYDKLTYNFNKQKDCVYYEFNQLVNKIEWDDIKKNIIKLLKELPTDVEVASQIGMTVSNLVKHKSTIVNKIQKIAEDVYADWYYLDRVKGSYIKCKKCGEIKLSREFHEKPNTKLGYDGTCKQCRKS